MKLINILFCCLFATACSHITLEDRPLDETSLGGQSIKFLEKDTVFISVHGDSAWVKSHGYFFYLDNLYAIQGTDTTKYRRGDNGEFELEDSTCLQVIKGEWYTVSTLSDKEEQAWGCNPILPVQINIAVKENNSGKERKLIMEAVQANSYHHLYAIQPGR